MFGASGAIRHTLSGDGGTITFAAESELARHWIVPIVVDLARDWTWDDLDGPISVTRDNDTVGAVTVPFVLSPQAGADPIHQDRTRTRLVFFDAVDPHEPTDSGFPEALPHTWTMTAATKVDAGPAVGVAGTPTFVPGYLAEPLRPELGATRLEVTLPIAVPPTQMPSIASVGIALSPYQAGDGYASTASRRRALWIELDEPVENGEGDTLFGRVVAHGADPLLYQATPSMEQKVEPPLVMDPELCRIVVPNDSDDRAGIGAMVELERATDGSTNRNVLLSHRYGEWTPPPHEQPRAARDTQRDRIGRATFLDEEVERCSPGWSCRRHRR